MNKKPSKILENFLERLTVLEKSRHDTLMLNPVMQMAYEILQELEAGKVSFNDLEKIIFELSSRAFTFRGDKLHRYVAKDCVLEIGSSFEAFNRQWSKPRFGIVFTAHPTFLLSKEAHRHLAEIAVSGDKPSAINQDSFLEPEAGLDLPLEHSWVQQIISVCHDNLGDIIDELLTKARRQWPEKWRQCRPLPLTVASWVGYDMDGRTDIDWCTAFCLRMQEKTLQVKKLSQIFDEIEKNTALEDQKSGLLLKRIGAIIERLATETQAHYQALQQAQCDQKLLSKALKMIVDQSDKETISPNILKNLLSQLIDKVKNDDLASCLIKMHSLLAVSGFGTAHLHFRVNASQIHNSLRALSNKTGVVRSLDRSALALLDQQIAELTAMETGFSTLQKENTTAIRQLVLIAQILKYIDSDTPIRFLVAETESTGTLLGTLYLATLFGVDEHIDISPLFETSDGLEHGAHIMHQLCSYDSFHTYIKKRGRLCVEAGFSDAGRFMGQVPAGLAIERFHVKLAATLKNNLDASIDVVLFNTHGESMGRGAHPENLAMRQNYILTPYARKALQAEGRRMIHEFSFQGGDGWLFFANRKLGGMVLRHLLKIENKTENSQDPFYKDQELMLEIFLNLKHFHEEIFRSTEYQTLLGAFGTNFIPMTGSRKTQRQYEFGSAILRGDPSQMRAIPNNALLQQLGYVINVAGGMGVISERERFVHLCKTSQRMQSLVRLVAFSVGLSRLDALAAYGMVLDTGFWTACACVNSSLSDAALDLADLLKEDSRAAAINRMYHKLRRDRAVFRSILHEANINDLDTMLKQPRLDIGLMHALRIALIMRIYTLAVRVPHFSASNDVSRQRIFSMVLSLDIDRATEALRKTFPRHATSDPLSDLGEKMAYDPLEINDYERLNDHLIMPMRHIGNRIRHISTAIACYFGAFG